MTTLDDIEPKLQILSRVWCFGDPELMEDLQQEARLAVWRQLNHRPEAPASFLKRVAEYAMLHYRKRGRSVDGLLDPRRRATRYVCLSADAPPPHDGERAIHDALSTEVLTPDKEWQAPTEDEAIGYVLCEELRGLLTSREDAILVLLLEGYTSSEAGRRLGIPHASAWRALIRIQSKAKGVLAQS